MSFTDVDKKFMEMALVQAQKALDEGDYPVGAVVTVNGELLGQGRNSIFSDGLTTSHAEANLLREHSAAIRQATRQHVDYDICLYTTLEPCLMCMGISALHRVTRFVAACPDHHGGAAGIDPKVLGNFYQSYWPKIEMGLMKKESADLLITFLQSDSTMKSTETMLVLFKQLKASW